MRMSQGAMLPSSSPVRLDHRVADRRHGGHVMTTVTYGFVGQRKVLTMTVVFDSEES
jgi:hypothetical protein